MHYYNEQHIASHSMLQKYVHDSPLGRSQLHKFSPTHSRNYACHSLKICCYHLLDRNSSLIKDIQQGGYLHLLIIFD